MWFVVNNLMLRIINFNNSIMVINLLSHHLQISLKINIAFRIRVIIRIATLIIRIITPIITITTPTPIMITIII